jgi:hypothetical protein
VICDCDLSSTLARAVHLHEENGLTFPSDEYYLHHFYSKNYPFIQGQGSWMNVHGLFHEMAKE